MSSFLESAESRFSKYKLIYLNFDTNDEINAHSLKDLKNVRVHGINKIMLFSESRHVELIMDIVSVTS